MKRGVILILILIGCAGAVTIVSHRHHHHHPVAKATCWAHPGRFVAGGHGKFVTVAHNGPTPGMTRHGRGPKGSDVCDRGANPAG